jgi:hypothetical protein
MTPSWQNVSRTMLSTAYWKSGPKKMLKLVEEFVTSLNAGGIKVLPLEKQ